jgi:carbon-monoxide dehydrogenase medium subunit
LKEAVDILSASKGEVRLLAGGTDLIDQLKSGRRSADLIVDAKHIPEMLRLAYDEKDGLHIGAAVSCTDIANHAEVKKNYLGVAQSSGLIGSVQIQNRAGIGGNVCNAAPSADTVPALLCHEGIAIIAGPKGQREMQLDEFFTGPGRNALGQGEMLLEILLPPPAPNSNSQYLRFIPREEMDIAVAGAGSLLAIDPKTKACTKARIALASVAPTPIRAREAEAVLEGKVITKKLLQEACEKASDSASPITDVRGSIEYRKELVKVLTRRTLERCLDSLGTNN